MYLSPFFITNLEKRETVFKNPKILLTYHTVSSALELIPALDIAKNISKSPLLIISKDLEGEALETLILNVASKIIEACSVKAPGSGNEQGRQLKDIAILTGGTVFVKDQGSALLNRVELKDIAEAHLGTAEKVIISENKITVIADGGKAITMGREHKTTVKNRERLIKDLNDKDSARRLSAMGTLSIGDTWAVEPIIKALEDEMRRVRRYEKNAIGYYTSYYFCYTAAWHLGCIGDTRAKGPLIRLLNRTEYPSSRDKNPIEWVCYSIVADALKELPGVGDEFERLGLYNKGEEFYNYHEMLEEAAAMRRKKATMGAVDHTVIHGDYIDDRDTIVKDSVVNKSNIGSGGDDKFTKLKELKEMLSEGLIDDDEFKQMKKEILGK